jgi:protein-tyrosine phosphatase
MTLITPQLALGSFRDPVEFRSHVEAYLCCAAEVAMPGDKPGYRIPLKDREAIDDGVIDGAFAFLDEQIASGRLVLVYCAGGRSRSVSLLVGYLSLRSGRDSESVLGQIKMLRPGVSPAALTLASIVSYVNRKRDTSRKVV